MKKLFLFFLVLILSECSIMPLSGFAQGEQLIITTYYPSPSGSYNELGVDKLAVNVSGDANSNQVAVASEFRNMRVGDAHVGWSMIVGSGGGSEWAYDELCPSANPLCVSANALDRRPGDGTLLVKDRIGIGETLPQPGLHIARDGSFPFIFEDAYGWSGTHTYAGHLVFRTARGTKAAPAPSQLDDILGILRGEGYGNSKFADESAGIYFAGDGPYADDVYPGRIDFYTTLNSFASRARRMTIKSNGFVGIGTGAPTEKLHVSDGSVMISSSGSTPYLRMKATVTTQGSSKGDTVHAVMGPYNDLAGGPGDLYIGAGVSADGTANNIVLYRRSCAGSWCNVPSIRLNANETYVGLDNTQRGNLTVNGNIYASGTVTWGASDARLKKDVQELSGVLGQIKDMRGVRFNWDIENNTQLGLSKDRQVGMIAQEVEKAFPELVTMSKDGYKTLAYDRFAAVLLEAIKEQQGEIEDLRKEIKALKGKVGM